MILIYNGPGFGDIVMYVCVCNAVKATHVQEALANGCTTVEDLSTELGLGTGCGTCVEYAQKMLEDVMPEPASADLAYAAA
ncbi:MAG: (2Fe-2S)-binding protein [Pseudomonadales bacterium]|nr:(2Fe-2S)-binding protein [Pseudomonadales bacterium]